MPSSDLLILEQLSIGPMANFSYFIGCKQTNEVGMVDPGWDAEAICAKADKMGCKITAIILTHSHYDHDGALHDLLRLLGGEVPVYISSKSNYDNSIENFKLCEDNLEIGIGNIKIKCLHTPGHSKDSMCLLCCGVLITGDTLFVNGCGRTDLPGGNVGEMYNSLYNVIMNLPDETIIYPGHDYGPSSSDTIVNQKKANHFLTCSSENEFISERM